MKPKRYLIVATHKIPDVVRPQLYKSAVDRLRDGRTEVLRLLGPAFNQKRGDIICIDRVSSSLYNAIDARWLRD